MSTPALIPGWVRSQRAARNLCQDCGQRRGETYWQSATGPLICWDCCEKRRKDGAR